jgi:glucokinase
MREKTISTSSPEPGPLEGERREERYGAIDIGGTKLAVGVTDGEGRVLAQTRDRTDVALGPEGVCARLVEMLEEARRKTGDRLPLKAVGIGCGGPLDRRSGIIITVPNLPGWDGFRLRGYFEDRLNLPVVLDNDANAAGLAEALFGAGRGLSHVCYFTISTGIGGGIVVDGRLYRGATELAAEFGHQVILPDGPRCACGKWGCLEALASGPSIARRAREKLAAGATSLVWDLAEGDPSLVTAERLAEAARRGDPLARELWEETGYYLGIGMANVINILNPSVIVAGGGVSAAGDLLLEPARRAAKERGMIPLTDACEILPAALGPEVGIVGAAALAMEATE